MVISDLESRSDVMVSRVLLVEGKTSDFSNPTSSPPPSPLHLQPSHSLHPPTTVPISSAWLRGEAVMRVLHRRRHASPSETLASPTSPLLFATVVSCSTATVVLPFFPLCDAFDVKLDAFEAALKIKVIREVRTFTSLGLREAKDLVEKVPTILKKGMTKEEAETIIAKLEEVRAKASME